MITASRIPDNLRAMVHKLYNGYCATEGCVSKEIQCHHRISNSKNNLVKYPLYMKSIFVLVPLCYDCHHNKSLKQWRVTDHQAQIFEDYLTQLKGAKK